MIQNKKTIRMTLYTKKKKKWVTTTNTFSQCINNNNWESLFLQLCFQRNLYAIKFFYLKQKAYPWLSNYLGLNLFFNLFFNPRCLVNQGYTFLSTRDTGRSGNQQDQDNITMCHGPWLSTPDARKSRIQ